MIAQGSPRPKPQVASGNPSSAPPFHSSTTQDEIVTPELPSTLDTHDALIDIMQRYGGEVRLARPRDQEDEYADDDDPDESAKTGDYFVEAEILPETDNGYEQLRGETIYYWDPFFQPRMSALKRQRDEGRRRLQ